MSVAIHSLFPSLILSAIRGSNRYLLSVHYEPLPGHQQSGICQVLEGFVWKRWWQLQKMSAQKRGAGPASGQRAGRGGNGYSRKEFSITRQIFPTRLENLRAGSRFEDHFVSLTLEIGKLRAQDGNKDEK